MGNFSDELLSIMKNRKIAVDDIILSTNISRAAFFKYRNGTRLPAKAEVVETIADALCLNQSDKEHLLEAYKIDSIGEYKYRGMKAVERFLTTPIGEYSMSEIDIPSPEQSKMANVSVVHGKMQVIMHICSVIQEGLEQGDVTVFETVCKKYIFSIIEQAKKKSAEHKIEHIMAVNGSDDIQTKDRIYSIEGLGRLITTMCRCENYYPFYYYASLSTLRSLEAFPNNIVVTGQCVLCFSGEMDCAILYRDEGICSLYRKMVMKWRRDAKPFAEKMDLASSIMIFNQFANPKDVSYTFAPGLCISAVYEPTDHLLETNLLYDKEGIRKFASSLPEYFDNFKNRIIANKDMYHFVITGNALRYNLRTGYVQELPKKICIPLNSEQRQTLMRRFQRVADKYNFRVIEDEMFPEDNGITVEARSSETLIIVVLPDEAYMRLFLIKERSASGLIYEYIKDLYENKGIGGEARSAWFENLLTD